MSIETSWTGVSTSMFVDPVFSVSKGQLATGDWDFQFLFNLGIAVIVILIVVCILFYCCVCPCCTPASCIRCMKPERSMTAWSRASRSYPLRLKAMDSNSSVRNLRSSACRAMRREGKHHASHRHGRGSVGGDRSEGSARERERECQ